MANTLQLFEAFLKKCMDELTGETVPSRLNAAMRFAVLEGGSRLRPRLLFNVVKACGASVDEKGFGAGAAIEMVHCASLVHDDLPTFDNAPVRRGKPAVHRRYGEAAAILAGDALILGAFTVLAEIGREGDFDALPLVRILARSAGTPGGATAGQGWELEEPTAIDLAQYHEAKTGAMFECATMFGAILAGRDPGAFRLFGNLYGKAYQLIDDILDATGANMIGGKLAHRDAELGRPNTVHKIGLEKSRCELAATLEKAKAALPPCPHPSILTTTADALLAKIDEP